MFFVLWFERLFLFVARVFFGLLRVFRPMFLVVFLFLAIHMRKGLPCFVLGCVLFSLFSQFDFRFSFSFFIFFVLFFMFFFLLFFVFPFSWLSLFLGEGLGFFGGIFSLGFLGCLLLFLFFLLVF